MIRNTFILITILILTLLVYGNRIEPRWLEVTEHHLDIENHPIGSGSPIRIAFLADFQVGMWLGNTSVIDEAVSKINQANIDILLIGGDFLYHPTEDDGVKEAKEEWTKNDVQHTQRLLSKVVQKLEKIHFKKTKVFAVLGNHDFAMEKQSAYMVEEVADNVKAKLSEIGIKLLENQIEKLELKNRNIEIGGLGPFYPSLDQPKKVLNQFDAKSIRILFMHNANSIREMSDTHFDLAIAGHTHGGQIRVPFFPSWSWTSLVPHTPDEVMGDGWIKNEKWRDKKVYINRGLGFSKLPLRLNCRPELTIFEL